MSAHRGFTLIELMIVVAIIGIVAVVAIPVYSKYQTKTKVTAALAEVKALRTGFEATVNQGAVPTLALVGGSAATSPNCTITMTGSVSTGAGTIVCALQNVPSSLAGKSITLNRSPDGDWSCTSTVDDEYRPKGCAAPSEG